MGDVKLFRLGQDGVHELPSSSVAIEKSLQTLVEKHLEAFLGVRFLASEYSTGKAHGGRIDTLGLDENNCPVIIEYKRALNENVINQGLFYLNWLMDHMAEFKLLVLEKYGKEVADAIDWNAPRLLCIAGDFTKYDEHAIQQMSGNIELIRYRQYGDDLLLLELVAATSGAAFPVGKSSPHAKWVKTKAQGQQPEGNAQGPVPAEKPYVLQLLDKCSSAVQDRFESLRAYALAFGDVQERTVQDYITFRKMKGFANVAFRPQKRCMLVYVNVSPESIPLQQYHGFARDMRDKKGYSGVWQLELTIDSDDDLERAKPLIRKSYEAS